MAAKRANEIPTIDVVLVTIKEADTATEFALDTASKISVNVQTETKDAVKLIVKGRLIAQKPAETTVTGNTIVITDNVFTPELVKMLQGGTIKYWTTEEQNMEGTEDTGNGVASYEPPAVGSTDKGKILILSAYSAVYSAAGVITGYEKIEYPNCQGIPIAMNSEDGVFRASEYTINSAPDNGQAPYKISYLKELPPIT